ncbi:MAG: metallopeptidase family protein [Bacteroidetes bacterium]|jgi:predicted Zn-dependent protease with MMP-like domain|nr:metallopeptidase family protein [Bacteroidota bacterium]
MDRDEFEKVVQEVFDSLPPQFHATIDNVHIVVEELPASRSNSRKGIRSGGMLLGLYEGIPLTKRGVDYGMYPVVPDRITLFRQNIQAVSRDDHDLRATIRETLIHEIGHYYGMSETEIRRAGY